MDDAAVSLATDHRTRSEQRIDDVRLADGGDMAGDTVLGRNHACHATR